MQLKDTLDPLLALLQDTKTAEELLAQTPTQFFRRAYIRSSFAYIEGTVWILKRTCLGAAAGIGHGVFSPAEYALLSDESYELSNSGAPMAQTKYLRLADNVKFTNKMLTKFFGSNLQVEYSKKSWNNFRTAVDFRNRITHPKSVQDYTVSDTELEVCREATHWFNAIVDKQVSAIQSAARNAAATA